MDRRETMAGFPRVRSSRARGPRIPPRARTSTPRGSC